MIGKPKNYPYETEFTSKKVTRREVLKGVAAVGMASVLPTSEVYAENAVKRRNLIIEENTNEGALDWQLTRVRADISEQRTSWIEGYCNRQSIKAGETIDIMVSTLPARDFTIEIFRTGYYGGRGARLMKKLGPFSGKTQPVPLAGEKNIHECNWKKTVSITIPYDWVSGVYLGRLTTIQQDEEDAYWQSYVIFIVKDDRPADILFQCSDNTWQAYNRWPNNYSLYTHPDGNQGPWADVSFDRPYGRQSHDRECLAVLQMIRKGLFGTPMHATCGYRHAAWGSAKWLRPVNTETKTEHFIKYAALRNADQYPTHGIGPVANWFDITRGNQFSYLTSVSTKSQAINEYVRKHPQGGEDHPNASFKFKQGDIVTTTVKTVKGETIVVNYDNYLPRPYSRDYSLQGTNGAWSGQYLGKAIYIEGKSPRHQWERDEVYDNYMREYDHDLWKEYSSEAYARDRGHGGMDYFMVLDFVRCVRDEKKPPIDIYDAAAWSVIIPLSEASLAKGSTPEYFPDFTKGAWKTNPPVEYSFDM